jgi:hypothetical protein
LNRKNRNVVHIEIKRKYHVSLWVILFRDIIEMYIYFSSSTFNGRGKVSLVGFEVLTAVSTKMAVFWVVVYFYQTTRRYNPEDSHLRSFWFITAESPVQSQGGLINVPTGEKL